MLDYESFFKITYGLYIVASGDSNSGNGFVSNTVFQITAEPPQFAASCNKNNFTAEFIEKTGFFSVSVLSQETKSEVFTKFGYKSGREIEKFEGCNIKYGESGVPIVLDDSAAYFEMKVVKTVDVGSHIIFIGEVINCEVLDEKKEPITYAYYRQVRKASSPKNAPTYIDESKLRKVESSGGKKYKCIVCGFIYDEDIEKIKFSELPDDWVCPSCGSPKEDFIEI
jgi:flavin reductase (DIM6/NTAB) family NADH-FMN oxidoreductase RutF/rubredoxin